MSELIDKVISQVPSAFGQKVVITISDSGDACVFKVDYDPPLTKETKSTQSLEAAMILLDALKQNIKV